MSKKNNIMIVELDRQDIISLLKGIVPNYEVMSKIPKDLGEYQGGFNDKWVWVNTIPKKYTNEELYNFYLICKKSW